LITLLSELTGVFKISAERTLYESSVG
jgi:hypothetical protein